MKEFEIVLIKKCLSNHGTNTADSQLFLITDIPIILYSLNKREWIPEDHDFDPEGPKDLREQLGTVI